MRFTHDGQNYALDFVRKTEKVYVRDGKDEQGQKVFTQVDTKHPSTEARLLKVEKGKKISEWEAVTSAKVICYYKDTNHHDKFSLEDGRRWALKKLTTKLTDKGLKAAVWKTYLNRNEVKAPKVSVSNNLKVDLGTTLS